MSDRFSNSEKTVVDRDNRNMSSAGYPMGAELNDLWAAIDGGNIGITAVAGDVDALAKAAASRPLAFAQNLDTTVGLTFGHKGGCAMFAQSLVSVAAGTIALANTAVNYVEVNAAGTVSANTTGFTAGSVPLYLVTCAAGAISLVVNARVLLRAMQDAGITGKMMAASPKTKCVSIPLGTVSASGDLTIVTPAAAGKLIRASIALKTTVAADDTNYWTFGLVNKGAAGSGTTKMIDSTVAANSTKATGGSAITGYIKRALTLAADPDANHAAEDVLVFSMVKAAAGANLVEAVLRLDFSSEA